MAMSAGLPVLAARGVDGDERHAGAVPQPLADLQARGSSLAVDEDGGHGPLL
jgi:hypothetical protein